METHPRLEIEERIKQILVSELQITPSVLIESSSTTPLLGRGIGLDSMALLPIEWVKIDMGCSLPSLAHRRGSVR
jgi:hypothetical protein